MPAPRGAGALHPTGQEMHCWFWGGFQIRVWVNRC